MTDFELEAVWNSYKVITKIMTLNHIMSVRPNDAIPFAHDPDSDPSIKDLDRIIIALESVEEYECCSRLNLIKNEIQTISAGDNRSVDDHLIYGDVCLPSHGSSYWENSYEPWYMPNAESSTGSILNEEEGNIVSAKRLRGFISRLFNRSNKL